MITRLNLTGTYKEIGFEHGSKGKQQVIHSLETYEKLFKGFRDISWSAAKEEGLTFLNAIEKYDLNMIEEMEGIAEGAGVDFEDILALNARSEIALAGNKGVSFSDGCTTFGMSKPTSEDTIIGQNWDWKGSQRESLLLLNIEAKDKPKITMVTEGGMIGKIGYNSSGVGLCFNALITDKKSNAVPIHLGIRAILNSYNLAEAVSKISNGQVGSSASLVIGYDEGNGNGTVMNPEITPFGIDYVGGDDGRVAHTNHICSDLIKTYLNDMNEFKHEDSILRLKRANQLINISLKENKPIDESSFKTWLSDTFNAPNSINHYVNKRSPEHRQMETVFSIIINLSKRKATLRIGNDVTERYEEM